MDLINGKALTFLRRALPEDLAPINQVEVALSMGDSFVATGLTIEDNLLSRAAKATKGYAYLVQLVGYSIWQRANLHRPKSAIVSERDVTEGIALAEARFHDVVHDPAISGLGPNDIKYLLAMCEDKQQSKSAEIAKRMGKKTNEISSIRAKLLTKRGYSGATERLRAVCRAGPRYLSARECRGDSRAVLNRGFHPGSQLSKNRREIPKNDTDEWVVLSSALVGRVYCWLLSELVINDKDLGG